MRVRKKVLIIVFIIGFLINFCVKVEKSTEIKAEIVKAPELKVKEEKIRITKETDLFHQLGGFNVERNEFYILDYITEVVKKNIILTVYDIDTMKEKKKVRLKMGPFMAPGRFSTPLYDVSYFNGKYYVFEGKISVFDENFDFKYTTFVADLRKYFLSNSIDYMMYKGQVSPLLVLYDERGYTYKNWNMIFDIKIYNLRKNYKAKEVAFVDSFMLKDLRPIIKRKKGANKWYYNYFIPRVFAFFMDNKIVYGIGTQKGYYLYDYIKKEKKFIKTDWLLEEKYDNEDAKRIALYKKQDINERPLFKHKWKAIYRSFIEYPLYYQYVVRISDNEMVFLRDIDTKEKSLSAYFINMRTGECNKILRIPYPHHLNHMKVAVPYMYRVFYIDYEKGIYIYGDRDDEWNEIVRYCKFEVE